MVGISVAIYHSETQLDFELKTDSHEMKRQKKQSIASSYWPMNFSSIPWKLSVRIAQIDIPIRLTCSVRLFFCVHFGLVSFPYIIISGANRVLLNEKLMMSSTECTQFTRWFWMQSDMRNLMDWIILNSSMQRQWRQQQQQPQTINMVHLMDIEQMNASGHMTCMCNELTGQSLDWNRIQSFN